MIHMKVIVVFFSVIAATNPSLADPLFGSSKLLATAGVVQLEGAAGSGLTTWAVISGYGSNREIGANAHYTLTATQDYSLNAIGARFGFYDRVELSLTRQYFDTGEAGETLGLGEGFNFNQDIVGLKVKLFGDAVYAQNSWLPQVAAGIQYKTADKTAIINAIGGADDDDFDYYLSATKVLLEHSLVLTGATRLTRANQFGLLGFGGDKSSSHSVQFEGSIAYLLSKNIVLGVDLRTKPNNLGFAKEEDSWATYAVWLPNKNFSVTAAYVHLGDIALHENQRGFYLSLQMGF